MTPRQLEQRAGLYHQLGLLTSSGIPILQALETLGRKPVHRDMPVRLEALRLQIEGGSTLTDALRSLGHWMPAFDVAILNAGEQSGRLDQCFHTLAEHYRLRAQLIRELIGGLAYPAFVVLFAILLFPTDMLAGLILRGEVLRYVTAKGLILVPVLAMCFFLAQVFMKEHSTAWRSRIERMLHPVPVLGSALRELALSRFAAALEALISAGVGIRESLPVAAHASGSVTLSNAVSAWAGPMHAGRTPSELLSNDDAFPEMFANLYHSGEISGQMDKTLMQLHEHYHDEGRRKLQLLARWTPKVVYLAVAAGIGWQVIGFYSGYFDQINQAIGP